MMDLDKIAYSNLKNLSEFDKNKYISIRDKIFIEVKTNEDDNCFENLTDISDIEFSVYFTFNHMLTLYNLTNTYNEKKHILYLIDLSINNLYNVFYEISNSDDTNENQYIRFYTFLNNIDKLYESVYEDYVYYKCNYIIQDYFRYLLSGFKFNKFINSNINNILYGFLSKYTYDYNEIVGYESDASDDDNEVSDDKNKASDDENNSSDDENKVFDDNEVSDDNESNNYFFINYWFSKKID